MDGHAHFMMTAYFTATTFSTNQQTGLWNHQSGTGYTESTVSRN